MFGASAGPQDMPARSAQEAAGVVGPTQVDQDTATEAS